jgi:Plant protein of unknown function (DUF936)
MGFINSQVPKRKPNADEKPPTKEENKPQTPTKKTSSRSAPEDSEKLNRQRTPLVKKTNEAPSSLSLSNLVKVPVNNRKLAKSIASWGSLPSTIAKLGKVM